MWRTASDQVRLLEDTTGSGKANKSTIFAGGFNHPLDGLAAGVLARDGDVYLTCIPNLWKLKDTKGTGTADQRAKLLEGFVYRFNLGTDVAVLLMGMGATLRARGSLEALVVDGLEKSGTLHGALAR